MKKISSKTARRAKSYRRAQIVIETLLSEIQRGIQSPDIIKSEEWKKLFGTKDSIVANVQKLVATLGDLPEHQGTYHTPGTPHPEEVPLTAEEVQILAEWIKDQQGH